ncbi:hypothetical protein ACGFWG_37785 [Streptomyces sp. NPDC048405]|uniref:hypothetical protein n=1 Tax=Streptomyces TaxID=1883 RepID=UPI001FD61D99|nr:MULTISPECIES: hypothetical protein [Streptomyces]
MLLPQLRVRTSPAVPTTFAVPAVVMAGALALVPLAAACGRVEGAGRPSQTSVPAAAAMAPAKVEVIANLTGCEPNIRVEATELREGICHTEQGEYLITTFPEEKYKRTWLETARVYGGTYLVGSRWVVSAEPKTLAALHKRIGGDVQRLQSFGSSLSASYRQPGR